jgi:hypothetical protein
MERLLVLAVRGMSGGPALPETALIYAGAGGASKRASRRPAEGASI